MKKITLNDKSAPRNPDTGFVLDPSEQYVIDGWNEWSDQMKDHRARDLRGTQMVQSYFNWLTTHDIDAGFPEIPKTLVQQYYGVEPLWKTQQSQGIVVKDAKYDSYYIVIECTPDCSGIVCLQTILTEVN